MHPLWILLLSTLVVVIGIVRLRMGAFFALMLAAFGVSFLAPGDLADKIPRVVTALGGSAGKLAMIIASAAVIGQCMTDSGAADRIVRAFLKAFGEKRAPAALMSSGFVLSIPVFFDTVFYLLVPLARSLHRRTGRHYLLYILAVASGAVATHTLVPPTPGPLAVAQQLSVDIGLMMVMGIAVGLPCALLGLALAHVMQARFDLPMRPLSGAVETGSESSPVPVHLPDTALPSLSLSVLPIVLPVALLAAGTIMPMLSQSLAADHWLIALLPPITVLGDPNAALLIAAITAALVYVSHAKPGREKWGRDIELTVMSAGTIILITAAGGAFGAMLKEAGVGNAIQTLFTDGRPAGGLLLLLIGWLIASLLKISQGSTTVAMITASSMLAAMIEGQVLPFNPVYLALAIGFGGLCVVWMNDSGFWIIARMSGFTEMEVLKTWTLILIVISLAGLALTALLARFLPLI
jgi:gluconate:H+ symporter, GntP family